MTEYVEFKDKWYCKQHKLSFSKDSTCPKCDKASLAIWGDTHPIIEDGNRLNDLW